MNESLLVHMRKIEVGMKIRIKQTMRMMITETMKIDYE